MSRVVARDGVLCWTLLGKRRCFPVSSSDESQFINFSSCQSCGIRGACLDRLNHTGNCPDFIDEFRPRTLEETVQFLHDNYYHAYKPRSQDGFVVVRKVQR